jgi:predicted GTPase
MTMKVFIVLAAIAVMIVSVQAGAEKKADDPKKEDLDATIAHLLDFVRTSDVVFIRNGKEHSAEEAVDHIGKKYNHYKKKINTPEDFIEKSATKSMMSGKLYEIRLKDGTVITCRDWLTAELARYREMPAAESDDTASCAPSDTSGEGK